MTTPTFTNGGQVPASGNEKNAAQVIEELRAENANLETCNERQSERIRALRPEVERLKAQVVGLQEALAHSPTNEDLAEARQLLQAWNDGKEPGLATSRFLAKLGRQG